MSTFIQVPIHVAPTEEFEAVESLRDLGVNTEPEWSESVLAINIAHVVSFYPGIKNPDFTIVELITGTSVRVLLDYRTFCIELRSFNNLEGF